MNPREAEDQAFRAFAARHGLAVGPGGALPVEGVLQGVALSIAKVDRGQVRFPWPVTRYLATVPIAIPGGLVAYKPNFRWRLGGPRKISDAAGTSGLLGFVHHEPVGDPELDRKLVIYSDDRALARALLTAPEVKQAILGALVAAGHLRLHESRVALEVSERRGGVLRLAGDAAEVEAPAQAAVNVAIALGAAVVAVQANRPAKAE